MTSILKLSGNDESKAGVSPVPENSPQDLGTNWDDLRGLTKAAYQPKPSTRLRTALLAVLLVVALGSVGLVLHNHMPALVSFGEELSQTFDRLASRSPTPSTAAHEVPLPDLRSARGKRRVTPAPVLDAQSEQAYDPTFHPFYATAVVGGRHVPLMSNNSIVVLDMGNGTWKFGSELE
ncbi:MAG TPA: hypothetical protein VGR48_16575 [Terriglobales bacterium]|nr:hypothetical protein [Terriglobales bacterium]